MIKHEAKVFLDHDPSYRSPDASGYWSLPALDDRRLDERLEMVADDDGMRPAPEIPAFRLVVLDEGFTPVHPGGWKAGLLKGFIPFDCTYKDEN